FFWICAIGLLGAAIAVTVNRNPFGSAIALVCVFFFQALLFLSLESVVLFVVQMIIYVGVVMVLFLFIIRLLDIKGESKRVVPWFKIGAVTFLSLVLGNFFIQAIHSLDRGSERLTWANEANKQVAMPGTIEMGKELFSNYLLPFEATLVLLLMVIVGVLLLIRRYDLSPSDSESSDKK
ncbi:MAG: NADH-quinone oxidoreductase subunit J, partial [Verrucomicrobiota bacterium]